MFFHQYQYIVAHQQLSRLSVGISQVDLSFRYSHIESC